MRRALAIDIGASSGRHIVGWTEDGQLRTQEVYRFPNGVHEEDGHLCWNTEALVREVKRGIEAARAAYPDIASLAIDTWGVDYVLLRGDEEVAPVYAYRDSRTAAVIPKVHGIMPFRSCTGTWAASFSRSTASASPSQTTRAAWATTDTDFDGVSVENMFCEFNNSGGHI